MEHCGIEKDTKRTSAVFIVWCFFWLAVFVICSFMLRRLKHEHELRMSQRYDRLSRVELSTFTNDADDHNPRNHTYTDKLINV